MTDPRELSALELAAYASVQLRKGGFNPIVVGGSAVTMHAPEIYTSFDIDFVIPGATRAEVKEVLGAIGFKEVGRNFVRDDVRYTLDFVATTPFIEQDAIEEFAEIPTAAGVVRVYRIEDAIADRVSHFVHWNDREALDVAVNLARAKAADIDPTRMLQALAHVKPIGVEGRDRFKLARAELHVD